MKIGNALLVGLHERLLRLCGSSDQSREWSSAFKYAIIHNRNMTSAPYAALLTERTRLIHLYARHDEDGQILVENGVVFFEDSEKEIFDRNWREFLGEESTVVLRKIGMSDVPANLSVEEFENLMPMIGG